MHMYAVLQEEEEELMKLITNDELMFKLRSELLTVLAENAGS